MTVLAAPPALDRLASLGALADAVESRREELVEAEVRVAKKARRVAEGDVVLALARLRAFGDLLPVLEGRLPVGTVALVLPGNAALSNPVATVGTAFLGGNRVLARFPGRSRPWAEVLEPLLTGHLPGVELRYGPGRAFLQEAISDPAVAVVMVFGDDSWTAPYEAQVRRHRKRLVFEGPGNDPFLVLPGCDLEWAARDAVRGAYHDAGQACTSPERFYVHRHLVTDFTERVVELTRRQVVGPPEDPETTVGPIVRPRVVERIDAQLRDARVRGARILVGGRIEETRLADGTPGAFVHPTVLEGARAEMAVMRDETFGPVIPIQAVSDGEEAVALAAASRYGLAATQYGGGRREAEALAESHGRVYRDEIWLNFHSRELHAPYGGRKRSGWVWEWYGERFRRRDGLRTNAREFTREALD